MLQQDTLPQYKRIHKSIKRVMRILELRYLAQTIQKKQMRSGSSSKSFCARLMSRKKRGKVLNLKKQEKADIFKDCHSQDWRCLSACLSECLTNLPTSLSDHQIVFATKNLTHYSRNFWTHCFLSLNFRENL
jgi:hypothetical protein